MKKVIFFTIMVFLTASNMAAAVPISGSNGIEGLGSFIGDFAFLVANDTSADIVVNLKNTSPADNGGLLVAFAFNNPIQSISEVAYTADQSDFDLLGGPTFDNSVSAPPYDPFDFGGGLGNSWVGGGNPNGGLEVNQSGTFTFSLKGSGFLGFEEQDFFNEGDPWFAARFRGFDDDGSDKVPADPMNPVPEPATMVLLGFGLIGMAAVRRKFKK